jgi:hypothetical protein
MALNEQDESLLERYLDGELNEAEAQGLTLRLERDEELRLAYGRMKLAADALHWKGLSDSVQAARDRHTTSSKVKVHHLRWLRIPLAVAAILLLALFGIRLLQKNARPPMDAQQLYASHFIDYEPQRLRGTDTLSTIESAYRGQRYTQVVKLAGPASPAREKLLAALAEMQLGHWAGALQWLAQLEQTAFKEDAEFYSALAWMRLQRYDEALRLLRIIQNNPSHLYHRQVDAAWLRDLEALQNKK